MTVQFHLFILSVLKVFCFDIWYIENVLKLDIEYHDFRANSHIHLNGHIIYIFRDY